MSRPHSPVASVVAPFPSLNLKSLRLQPQYEGYFNGAPISPVATVPDSAQTGTDQDPVLCIPGQHVPFPTAAKTYQPAGDDLPGSSLFAFATATAACSSVLQRQQQQLLCALAALHRQQQQGAQLKARLHAAEAEREALRKRTGARHLLNPYPQQLQAHAHPSAAPGNDAAPNLGRPSPSQLPGSGSLRPGRLPPAHSLPARSSTRSLGTFSIHSCHSWGSVFDAVAAQELADGSNPLLSPAAGPAQYARARALLDSPSRSVASSSDASPAGSPSATRDGSLLTSTSGSSGTTSMGRMSSCMSASVGSISQALALAASGLPPPQMSTLPPSPKAAVTTADAACQADPDELVVRERAIQLELKQQNAQLMQMVGALRAQLEAAQARAAAAEQVAAEARSAAEAAAACVAAAEARAAAAERAVSGLQLGLEEQCRLVTGQVLAEAAARRMQLPGCGLDLVDCVVEAMGGGGAEVEVVARGRVADVFRVPDPRGPNGMAMRRASGTAASPPGFGDVACSAGVRNVAATASSEQGAVDLLCGCGGSGGGQPCPSGSVAVKVWKLRGWREARGLGQELVNHLALQGTPAGLRMARLLGWRCVPAPGDSEYGMRLVAVYDWYDSGSLDAVLDELLTEQLDRHAAAEAAGRRREAGAAAAEAAGLVVDYLVGLLRCLVPLHAARVVHNDVKGENCVLAHPCNSMDSDGDGTDSDEYTDEEEGSDMGGERRNGLRGVCSVDLRNALRIDAESHRVLPPGHCTLAGSGMMTPPLQAPEQDLGRERSWVCLATDVYSVGVEAREQLQRVRPAACGRAARRLVALLEAFAEACCAADPWDRPSAQQALELLEEGERW